MTMRLEVSVERQVPLDEIVVAVISVTTDDDVVLTGQLNLMGGDLRVIVTGPDGRAQRAGWPWPADSAGREIRLERGQTLAGGVPLLCTSSSQPLLDEPGRYTITATFAATGQAGLSAPAVALDRVPATDWAQAEALRERDVIQSLMSASALGAAGPILAGFTDQARPRVRTLAGLALDQPELTADLSQIDRAATLTAVLPADVFGSDPRLRQAVAGLKASDTTAAAMLSGAPFRR